MENALRQLDCWNRLRRLPTASHGEDLLEYGFLVVLIAIFALGAVATLGQTINSVFWQTIANNF